MKFEFATAGRILFGEGAVGDAPQAAAAMGTRALAVSGGRHDRAAPLERALEAAGLGHAAFPCAGEPTVETARSGAALARNEGCDMVIALGGGSAIDAGKAIAALLANPGDVLDYLEVIGRGKALERPSVPFIAIPTTAGTGSEVTRNAVLASPHERVKASLRGAGMLPRLAVVDPELTYSMPRAVTASTGLDALTQLIEPYVSTRANRMTDTLAVDGIRRAACALPRVWDSPDDRAARAEMSWASLLGGLALANAGLGAVHGFAAPIGGMFAAPHGAVCAALLPQVMRVNVAALRARDPAGKALTRYEEVARLLTGRAQPRAEDGADWVAALCAKLEIPALRTYGISPNSVPDLVEKASRASSMKANPITLTAEELTEALSRAL